MSDSPVESLLSVLCFGDAMPIQTIDVYFRINTRSYYRKESADIRIILDNHFCVATVFATRDEITRRAARGEVVSD